MITKHVCSPEMAKILFDLGIKQESIYVYVKYPSSPIPVLMERPAIAGSVVTDSSTPEYMHAAFLATELEFSSDYAVLSHDDCFVGYECTSWMEPSFKVIPDAGIIDEREVECRAKMVAYLKKQGII